MASGYYIASYLAAGEPTIRFVNSAGIITTPAFVCTDPLWAAIIALGYPQGFGFVTDLASDNSGNVYAAANGGHKAIWKIDPSLNVTRAVGMVSGAAGSGSDILAVGDGGPATAATLYGPGKVATDATGNLYIIDGSGVVAVGGPPTPPIGPPYLRVVNMQATTQTLLGVNIAPGDIESVPIPGTAYWPSGSSTFPVALLNSPSGICVDSSGNCYFVAFTYSSGYPFAPLPGGFVYRIDTGGGVTLFAGNSDVPVSGEFSGGGSATNIGLSADYLCADSAGNIYITNVYTLGGTTTVSNVIIVHAGTAALFAGSLTVSGFAGDGGPATSAELDWVAGSALIGLSVRADSAGNLYISDAGNFRIRMVAAGTGIITTVAGNGTNGSTGDGGVATSAEIQAPMAIAFPQAALVLILITPSDPTVAPGGTQQFTATGTYSDSSTLNLTSSAVWTSAIMPVATIAAGGLATGVGVGSSTITATSGAVSGSTLLTVSSGSGGSGGNTLSERSFACNGCFESSSAYGDVLKSLALSMAGFVVPPGDCWRVYAGSYVPPSVILADGDCRGAIKADFRLSSRDICNGVKGQYIPGFLPINPLGPLASSPASSAWKKTDFPPVQRANYIAEDAGIILWKDIQLDFTISLWMAQRIARIILERLRRQVTVSVPAKLTGLALLAADTMQFLHTRWAGVTPPVPTVFQVSHTALRMESQADGVPAFGTDLVLRQTDAAVYEFTPPSSPTNFGDYSSYGQLGIGDGNVE